MAKKKRKEREFVDDLIEEVNLFSDADKYQKAEPSSSTVSTVLSSAEASTAPLSTGSAVSSTMSTVLSSAEASTTPFSVGTMIELKQLLEDLKNIYECLNVFQGYVETVAEETGCQETNVVSETDGLIDIQRKSLHNRSVSMVDANLKTLLGKRIFSDEPEELELEHDDLSSFDRFYVGGYARDINKQPQLYIKFTLCYLFKTLQTARKLGSKISIEEVRNSSTEQGEVMREILAAHESLQEDFGGGESQWTDDGDWSDLMFGMSENLIFDYPTCPVRMGLMSGEVWQTSISEWWHHE